MKVACILITHFPWKAEVHRRSELRDQPLLLVRTAGSQRTIADYSPSLPGVAVGMKLQKAMTFAQGATLLEADDVYYASKSNSILDALEKRSPVVEDATFGCAYVGLDGLEALYGGGAQLISALQGAVPAHFDARIGVATGKFMAYLAALSSSVPLSNGDHRGSRQLDTLDGPTTCQSFVQRFPVDVLPISFKTKDKLRQFALHTLKDIAGIPLNSMQAQFGPEGKRIWELSQGIDDSPLTPRNTEEVISESLSFTNPTSALEAILLAIEVLLGRAFRRPELKRRLARRIVLEAHIYRRSSWTKGISLREAAGKPGDAMSRIKSVLERTSLPGPLEDVTVSLKSLCKEAGRQVSLFAEVRCQEQIQQALRDLDARLGRQAPVFRMREVEPWSRIPERRYALAPADR